MKKMILGEDHATAVSFCPACGYKMEAAFCVGENAAPREGDVTICGGCGKLLVFTEDLGVRTPTEAEREEILAMPSVQEARRITLEFQSWRASHPSH